MNILSHLWPRLERVHPTLTDPELRRQSLLLARLLLVLLLLCGMYILIQIVLAPGFRWTLAALVTALGLLTLAASLNHQGRYRTAGMIAVTVMLAGCFGDLFFYPRDVLGYAYFAIPLFLARLFLPGILFVTLPVVVIAAVLGMAWLQGSDLPQAISGSVFLATMAIIFGIARQHRLASEQDRRAALAASERELRMILDNLQDTYYRTDLDGRIVRASASVTQLLGYTPDEMLGKHLADFYINADGREKFLASLAAAGGTLRNFESALRHRNGSVRWLLTNAQYVRNADGQALGVEGTARDVTDRKRAEDRLLEIARGVSATTGETFFHSLVAHLVQSLHADFAFVGQLLPGQADRIRTIAAQAGDQRVDDFEYDLAGTPCQNVVGKETCAYARDVQQQFPDDHMLVEMGVQAYVGTPLFASNGASLGLLVVLYRRTIDEDLTIRSTLEIFATRAAAELERLQAEQSLRDSEARYRIIVETAQEGIWQIDADNLTSYVNLKMADMLHYSAEEMHGKPLFAFMDDTGITLAQKNLERRQQGYSEQHEFKFRRKDGGEIWTLLNTVPLRDDAGRYAGAFAMITDISESRRAEQALRESESKYRELFENMTSGFALHEIICDGQGKPVDYRYLQVNPAFEKLTGVHVADLVGKRIREILPGTEDYWIEIFGKVALTGEPVAYENYSREIGKYFDTWVFSPQKNQFAVIFTDITTRKIAESEMRKLSSALEQTADSVIISDRQGIIEYVNFGFEKTTGYGRDEAVGQKPSLLNSGKQGAGFYKKLWGTILAGEVFSEVFVNRRKDGSLYYEEKTITPLKDAAGQVTHFIATGKDVTERMQTQERLQHMAQHDALTELPNRLLFMDRLKQALARARWHERLVAVLFVDLDRFKTINDTLGHEVGDKLLQALAGRLTASVREGDTVARFGGDEFAMLLDDVASEKDIGAVAQKVIEMLAPPFEIDGQSLYITASIGVSLYPNDGEDSTTLLKNADIAMYRAKDLGKNTYQFYSADMSARAFERLTLESSLRHAIERYEFRLYYQPQIDTVSGAIIGVEALLRWQHPDFGLVAPAEFIPLLEETGLIVPVGDWVLRTACEQLCAWHAAGWPMLRMAVNLSPRQFQTAGLAESVERALSTLGCDPGLFELEITEGVLLRHTAATVESLEALHALGVRMAIDDFGTGYSSLSYLRRYAIDTLKIDRSFVRDVPGDADDSALASAIIVLAQSLKLDVIAEGVETEAQCDFLRERGCQVMQGYLFSRPLPADEIPRLLETRNPKG